MQSQYDIATNKAARKLAALTHPEIAALAARHPDASIQAHAYVDSARVALSIHINITDNDIADGYGIESVPGVEVDTVGYTLNKTLQRGRLPGPESDRETEFAVYLSARQWFTEEEEAILAACGKLVDQHIEGYTEKSLQCGI